MWKLAGIEGGMNELMNDDILQVSVQHLVHKYLHDFVEKCGKYSCRYVGFILFD